MKLKRNAKKSLAEKFVFLMGSFLLFFVIISLALLVTLYFLDKSYANEREVFESKEKIAKEINDDFNQTFFDMRGYLALNNSSLKDQALAQEPKIRSLAERFAKKAVTDEDQDFLNSVQSFSNFYFDEMLPNALAAFESGKQNEVVKIANNGATTRVEFFQKSMKDYIQLLENEAENHFQKLLRMQTYIESVFIVFILSILLLLVRFIVMMVRQMGQPLSKLAEAANEIASGNETSVDLEINREDEIGFLAKSFKKMTEKVWEKEQDLVAHNEELLAQQEELQAQQSELKTALEILKANEEKLKNRNKVINQISNSLSKQEVLDSIVVTICKIIEADQGIIVSTNDKAYASYGVPMSGVHQFLNHVISGLLERLTITKEPFTIRRMLDLSEKGYHEGNLYCHDLYLPVLTSDEEVVAVMMYTRYGNPFHASQMEEYKAHSRSIGNTLEKLSLFQKTEEERKRNQEILNTLQEGVQLIDRNGTILQVNDYLCKLYHCSEASLQGMTFNQWTSLMKEMVMEDGFIDHLNRITELKPHLPSEEKTFLYTMENPYRVIKLASEELYHGNEKFGTILIHRDITKEYEVDQMKSEFVSTVSHELRTPLSSILGFTELLLNRELKPERQKKYLSTIFNETNRLTALINDFLDVQRMEAGKQTYEKKYIHLLPILTKIIEVQQAGTKIHQIVLESEAVNPIILGDKAKIEQVFTNLIHNAIKYSPNGGDISVRVTEQEREIRVAVSDQGLGIPKDAIAKLFTKFYRVDNSDRRSIGGTGLGLAIVQEILKAHEGNITVQSAFGEGSTFTAVFPAVPNSEEIDAAGNETQHEARYHILVIEDDQSLTELIAQELSENGFSVSCINDGRTALSYLKKTVPDAIVLDILLDDAEVDGWYIMKEIKDNDDLKQIPVIVSTALDEKEKGFSLGAMDYLVKPYKPSQLSKAIMQTLLKIGKVGQILVPEGKE
ncbi:ATP-binding protein [Neobacillus sp. SM06]|uniref:ATP-binding protein n=1 Tax=Neobacillus sp. SM06 TaxID=3422492 RepID=UPI003D2A350E